MSKNGWNSPEANAYVKKEHDHAIMQAKVTLACACAEGEVFEKLGDFPYELYGELNNELGDANYRVHHRPHLCGSLFAGSLGRRRKPVKL